MIIWLASYPKSGNTLLRSVLSTYFFSEDGNFNYEHLYKIRQFPHNDYFLELGIDIEDEKLIFKNYIKAQNLINQEKKIIKFFKTHSALCKIENSNFTDVKNTLAGIYIIRDPRNVVTSLAHHNQITIDAALEAMLDQNKYLTKSDKIPRVFVGSWQLNYNSWKSLNNRLLVIKYEDLVFNKKKTLIKVFKFLKKIGLNNLELDMTKLNKVIKTTDFEKMQNLEKSKIFTESMIDKNSGQRIPFFNLGPKNDWRFVLSSNIRLKIENFFQKEMEEMGYL